MKQYVRHFNEGVSESYGAGSVQMCTLGASSIEGDQAFPHNVREFYTAGDLTNLGVTVSSNTLNGDGVWRTALGDNGETPGSLSVTFAPGETGHKRDDSNVEAVDTTKVYSFICDCSDASSGAMTVDEAEFIWEAATGAVTLLGANGPSSTGASSTGQWFIPAHGQRLTYTTEEYVGSITAAPGTWRNLSVGFVGSNVTTLAVNIHSRINGATGNQTVALDQTMTHVRVADDSNADAVVEGEQINWLMDVTAHSGDGGMDIENFLSQIDHPGSYAQLMLGGGRVYVPSSQDAFFPLSGQTGSSDVEADVSHHVGVDVDGSHLAAFCPQGSGTLSARLRINGADGNQNVTVPGSPNGAVDDSNTDTILADDLIAVRASVPSSNIRISGLAMRVALSGPDFGTLPEEVAEQYLEIETLSQIIVNASPDVSLLDVGHLAGIHGVIFTQKTTDLSPEFEQAVANELAVSPPLNLAEIRAECISLLSWVQTNLPEALTPGTLVIDPVPPVEIIEEDTVPNTHAVVAEVQTLNGYF